MPRMHISPASVLKKCFFTVPLLAGLTILQLDIEIDPIKHTKVYTLYNSLLNNIEPYLESSPSYQWRICILVSFIEPRGIWLVSKAMVRILMTLGALNWLARSGMIITSLISYG